MGERHVIEDFDLFGGLHCETSAVGKVLSYNGLSLSEEMLLGVGCGIGFIYWYMKRMKAPLVGGRGGRSEDLMDNIAKAIDGTIARITTGSQRRAHAFLLERLARRQPTVVSADIAFLPYMASPEAGHFGGHTIVVYGIDEDEDRVLISDRGRRPVSITVDDLRRARGSKFPPFPPKNAFLDIRHPMDAEIGPGDILRGIDHTVRTMTEPPFSGAGLRGMAKWADMVLKWPSIFRGKRLLDVLISGFIYIELGGTGGSSFRPMYCRFLKEAREILGEPLLSSAVDMYAESGRIWSEVAELHLPDEFPGLRRIRELQWESDRAILAMEDGYLEELSSIREEMKSAYEDGVAEVREAGRFLPDLREGILRLKEVEGRAVAILKGAVS
jgi:hypothetical protein